jgi:hypothetical protein
MKVYPVYTLLCVCHSFEWNIFGTESAKTFLFCATDFIVKPTYYVNYSTLLPLCTGAAAVIAMCKYCGKIFGFGSNPYSNYMDIIQLLHLNVIPVLRSFSEYFSDKDTRKGNIHPIKKEYPYLCLNKAQGVSSNNFRRYSPYGPGSWVRFWEDYTFLFCTESTPSIGPILTSCSVGKKVKLSLCLTN